MTARGRVTSSTDWDPMRDDFNNSSYDAQYQDNDNNDQSAQSYPLDHRRLYIKNIPVGLNEQGLRSAFEKYGQLEQAFLSRDPKKKFGLIRYETPAEARIAMMKLNHTEPLNLHINFAHAKQSNNDGLNNNSRTYKDSVSTVSRRSRNQEEPINGEMEEPANTTIDRDFHIELEQIKLEKLKIQEEQLMCRQKMMLLQMEKRPVTANSTITGSSRRLLPDGRVIVQERVQEPDMSFTAGAGDSLNIPGLQREVKRGCIVCGAGADMFCARCGVTPYCSERCQRRDWPTRHSAVCHNLMRLQSTGNAVPKEQPAEDNAEVHVPSPPAPLRRPRSPIANRGQPQRDNQPANFNKDKARFVPPDHHPVPSKAGRGRAPVQDRRPRVNQEEAQDEEWGAEKKAEPKLPEPKPVQSKADPMPKMVDIKVEPARQPHSAKPDSFKPNMRMGANLNTETPKAVSKLPEVAMVPAQYLIETLPIGESFLLSVEQAAKDCATKQPGFVCLAIHADYREQFNSLLGDIFENETSINPQPGETFAYLDQTDSGWYRARRLTRGRCGLLDAGRVALLEGAGCRALARTFTAMPEFCCVLQGNVQVSMSLKCTILLKTAEGYKVSIDTATEDSYLGEGTVTRWLPEVELPAVSRPPQEKVIQPTPPAKQEKIHPLPDKTPQQRLEKARAQTAADITTSQAPTPKVSSPQAPTPKVPTSQASTPKALTSQVPEVPRPAIVNGGLYILMHVTSLKRACVRSCDAESTAEFENVLQDTALYGMKSAKQLTSPPTPGQLVLSLFEDVHYRALVKRTKAADNRYMVEYVEYGNEEVVPLDKLYTCPSELDLTARPAKASIVALSTITCTELPLLATHYLDTIKEQAELVATTPDEVKSAPSGSLVQLAIANNKESMNRKLEEMCTPEWKKLEKKGGDVIDSAVMLYPDMKTLPLPIDRPFVMEVTDFSNLETGVVCGFPQGEPLADQIYGPLTDKINEYCNSELCSEPYLPMVEELCLAKLPPYPQWFRAVVVEHRAGEAHAAVLFTDYGNMEAAVPVTDLRKCLREFCGPPALAATADIKDWPKPITAEQIVKAVEFLKINDEGRGQLPVRRCKRIEDDLSYEIEAPELIAALKAQ